MSAKPPVDPARIYSTSELAAAVGRTPGRRRRSPVYVDRAEVKECLGLADNRSLDRYVRAGWCPKPARWLTPRRPVWMRKEWEAWLKGRGDHSPDM